MDIFGMVKYQLLIKLRRFAEWPFFVESFTEITVINVFFYTPSNNIKLFRLSGEVPSPKSHAHTSTKNKGLERGCFSFPPCVCNISLYDIYLYLVEEWDGYDDRYWERKFYIL